MYSERFDRYYVGQTADIATRLARHNSGIEKATAAFMPWILILTIQKESRAEAMKLEIKLKNLNRQKLLEFIAKYR